MIRFLLGVFMGSMCTAYLAQAEISHVKSELRVEKKKQILSVRFSDYKKCEFDSVELVGNNITETTYRCGPSRAVFVRSKEVTYHAEN